MSTWLDVRTKQAPPEGLSSPIITVTGPSSVSIAWSPPEEPNGELVNMTLVLFEEVSSSIIFTRSILSNKSLHITDPNTLSPFTSYFAIVVACTAGGCTQSASSEFTTEEDGWWMD